MTAGRPARPWPRLAACEIWFAHGAGTPDARLAQAEQIRHAVGVAPVRIPWWEDARPGIEPRTDLDAYLRARFDGAPPADVHLGPGGVEIPDLGDLVSGLERPVLRTFYHSAIPKLWRTIADAVYYLHHGQEMRGQMLAWMAARGPRTGAPRIAVGLSLGGLLLVDALAVAPAGTVDAVVTVGSQVPMVYQCGGLTSLPRTSPPPSPFQPWLNVWDPDDYMSFPVRSLFGADARIVDRLVQDPAFAFPDDHSNYFAGRAVYDAIEAQLEAWSIGPSG
jgi:hypothetical protein